MSKKIVRERWIIQDDMLPDRILCGRPPSYDWRCIDNIGDAIVSTYPSEKQALAGYAKRHGGRPVKIRETIEILDEG